MGVLDVLVIYSCGVIELGCLRRLCVAHIPRVTTSGVADLWTGSCTYLEHIDLSYTSVEDDGNNNTRNVFRALLPHDNLTSLSLDGTAVGQHVSLVI